VKEEGRYEKVAEGLTLSIAHRQSEKQGVGYLRGVIVSKVSPTLGGRGKLQKGHKDSGRYMTHWFFRSKGGKTERMVKLQQL